MPALDATAPEVYREYYGMPMFVYVPTRDLAASADFWIRGLGFIDLFSIPDRLTHLRRWAFQDVLLVPTARRAGAAPGSAEANTLAERHRALLSGYFDCTHSMQACIARMFVRDPGFARFYDEPAPDMTSWLRDVIFANAEANGVADPASATWE
jgi:hypothetical protein